MRGLRRSCSQEAFARKNIHELVKVEHFVNKTSQIAAHTLSRSSGAKKFVDKTFHELAEVFTHESTAIDFFSVSSHLIKPGGVRHGCAQANVQVTPLGGQEAIKMVGNCCAYGCPNSLLFLILGNKNRYKP